MICALFIKAKVEGGCFLLCFWLSAFTHGVVKSSLVKRNTWWFLKTQRLIFLKGFCFRYKMNTQYCDAPLVNFENKLL